jgi:hypothetical protein
MRTLFHDANTPSSYVHIICQTSLGPHLPINSLIPTFQHTARPWKLHHHAKALLRTTATIMTTSNEQIPQATSHLNAKQKLRIQKRRVARQQLQEVFALKRKDTKLYSQSPPYPNAPHWSAGCMRCGKARDDRFLTAELTIQELEKLAIKEPDVQSAGVTPLGSVTREKPKL